MGVEPLADELRAFIAGHIRSVRALELLLLMQAGSAREWTAQALSDELRATHAWAAEELQFLASRGLLVQVDPVAFGYRFSPNRPELGSAVAALATLYPVRPDAIFQAIYAAPRESIRNFADAFRLRKEKPDG